MATIAVTGASGKLGSATIRFLLERKVAPASIIAIVRDPAKVMRSRRRASKSARATTTTRRRSKMRCVASTGWRSFRPARSAMNACSTMATW
jgi:nucleoside-diphosphate-sugar epimerase